MWSIISVSSHRDSRLEAAEVADSHRSDTMFSRIVICMSDIHYCLTSRLVCLSGGDSSLVVSWCDDRRRGHHHHSHCCVGYSITHPCCMCWLLFWSDRVWRQYLMGTVCCHMFVPFGFVSLSRGGRWSLIDCRHSVCVMYFLLIFFPKFQNKYTVHYT